MSWRKIIIENPSHDLLARWRVNDFICYNDTDYGEISIIVSAMFFYEDYIVVERADKSELLYYNEFSRAEFI